jgi:hypothetical protein
MERSIPTGSLVRAQADFFNPAGSFTRVTGLAYTAVSVNVFFNNAAVVWGVSDGSSTQDSSISSGSIYFHEISGNPGFYSVRFYPDRVGYWRVVLKTTSPVSSESIMEFDVVPTANLLPGLNASFAK